MTSGANPTPADSTPPEDLHQPHPLRNVLGAIFSRENVYALLLCLILLLLVIVTSDTSPQWIYQGF